MKTAVVTGAGRGLGRHIAFELASRGHDVLVTDIDEVAAADTAQRIAGREGGGTAWSTHQDVRDPESHARVAAAASERGELAVWVNNAGVLDSGLTWELSDDAVRRQVEINVLGVIWGCHAAARAMERGHILNIGSISAVVPTPGVAVYGATKCAVLGFSVSLQGEFDRARRPIRVSAICPDAIETDMVRQVEDQEHASLLFSSPNLLSAEDMAKKAVGLVGSPRLVAVYPRSRALFAHLLRPFPKLGLGLMAPFHTIGTFLRKRRS